MPGISGRLSRICSDQNTAVGRAFVRPPYSKGGDTVKKSIGIIANPASGKDIRRLVSYATVIDNNEKVNIVKRIVLAAQGLGIRQFYFMPDTFQVGYQVIDSLQHEKMLTAVCQVLDMKVTATAQDTVEAAGMMVKLGVGALVVLGGDGTSRAVAKVSGDVPILPVSTGTNNVYPEMTEGTVAGMAAAAAALFPEPHKGCVRDKCIEVYVNGIFKDIALIDAVVSDSLFQGARALWNIEQIRQIIVSRCHPASIGFSAIAGCMEIIEAKEDRGMTVCLSPDGKRIKAPVAAGLIDTVGIGESRILTLGEKVSYTADINCMVALDGEREVKVKKGDSVCFRIVREGPYRIVIREALRLALEAGIFSADSQA